MLLTAQKLVNISKWNGRLSYINYLVAASTLSVCNEAKEIPKIYHYAMLLPDLNQIEDNELLNAAERVIAMCDKENSEEMLKLINDMYADPTPYQREMTEKFREALLKTGPLGGLPRAINSLSELSKAVPLSLTASYEHVPKDASELCELFPRTKRSVSDCLEIERGMRHWNHIYGKVSGRVIQNLNRSYPDLWYYTMAHAYGPLLSYSEILDAKETSLTIIAALVPQDVNPQLWGHLKGALNVGCTHQEVENARSLSVRVAQWCGIEWKEEVVKLKENHSKY